MLYSACTSMEIIIGMDMLISSRLTGITPILFSGRGSIRVSLTVRLLLQKGPPLSIPSVWPFR